MNQFSSEEREVFDVKVRFVPGTVVVAVRGEIDVVTAADLNAMMVALAKCACRRSYAAARSSPRPKGS